MVCVLVFQSPYDGELSDFSRFVYLASVAQVNRGLQLQAYSHDGFVSPPDHPHLRYTKLDGSRAAAARVTADLAAVLSGGLPA